VNELFSAASAADHLLDPTSTGLRLLFRCDRTDRTPWL